MNVLLDRHHAGLFHSMQLLGARVGWTVYTPIGHEWWDESYWSFGRWTWPDDRLAKQYLEALQQPDNEFPDTPINFITLEQAREMRWDLVIATLQDNQEGFYRFAKETGAEYVYQVGNTRQQVHWGLSPTVLSNSTEVDLSGRRGVYIGQEFDSDGLFAYQPIRNRNRVGSFVNLMPLIDCGPLMADAQRLAPDLEFRVHGINCPDGVLKPIDVIAEAMADCGWAWHDKITGDGFGHVIHYWAAIGRPLIGHASHYRGQRAEGFWEDGVTCIDLDRHGIAEAVGMIRNTDPEPMGRELRRRFDAVIDWQRDADAVADLFRVAVAA